MPAKKRKTASVQPRDVTRIPEEEKYVSVSSLNEEQRELIRIIHKYNLILLYGVAGSGKTHISAGIAAQYLRNGLIDRIIVSRPVVASEEYGILKGGLDDKIEPFLSPLFDLFGKFLNIKQAVAQKKILVLPVAFMRGWTFDNTFVIIDEAENLTEHQLKLVLTRIGRDTKIVLNGDVTQSDLDEKHNKDYGRVINKIARIAGEDTGIATFELTKSVRNPLIEKIIQALK